MTENFFFNSRLLDLVCFEVSDIPAELGVGIGIAMGEIYAVVVVFADTVSYILDLDYFVLRYSMRIYLHWNFMEKVSVW